MKNADNLQVGMTFIVNTDQYAAYNAPRGIVLTVTHKDRQYVYADIPDYGEVAFNVIHIEMPDVNRELLEKMLSDADEELYKAERRKNILQQKIDYLEKTGKEKVVDKEFKSYLILDVVKNPDLSDDSKAIEISAILEAPSL